MEREISFAEADAVLTKIREAVHSGSPIKMPLEITSRVLLEKVNEFQSKRDDLHKAHVKTDENGKPLIKEGVDSPRMLLDFEYEDADAFLKLVQELADTTVIVDFQMVSSERPVYTATGEVPLSAYLEQSEKVSASTAIFLNEYFIE